jgi:hypothetical protein
MFKVRKAGEFFYADCFDKKIELLAKYKGSYMATIWLFKQKLSIEVAEPQFIWKCRKRIQHHIFYYWYMVKTIAHITPIYVHISITDCDHSHSERVMKVKNGYRHYKAEKDFYENLENRGSITRISKEEYEEFKPVSRDYVAEAHENGHPYNVRG